MLFRSLLTAARRLMTTAAPAAAAPTEIHLAAYTPPPLLVRNVHLTFALDKARTVVRAVMRVQRNPAAAADAPLVLHRGAGVELVDNRVAIDGADLAPADFALAPTSLTLLRVPEGEFELTLASAIDPTANKTGEGLYSSDENLCTQCEAEGFRNIIPFPDRPDVMATFRVRLEADKATYPVLLSNGDEVASGDLDGGRHFAEFDDPTPKPCYLFCLVAGKLYPLEDTFVRNTGKPVRLCIWVEDKADVDRCKHAMFALKSILKWDEDTYGRVYYLDVYHIVAVKNFVMGAMENTGLNLFASKYILADQESATDTDFNNVLGVVGHEALHSHSGNRVTLRDWFQLSLKEGFTVFRDQCFSTDMGEGPGKRISDVALLRSYQFVEDSSPMAHPVQPKSYIEINNFYSATVYEKGAEVVRMYRTLLGAAAFRKGTDLYFERHDGQAVTIEHFKGAMEDANGVDLSQLKLWYDYAGTPTVTVKAASYDAATSKFTLTLHQLCPATPDHPADKEKPPFLVPVAVGLIGEDGKDMPLNGDGATTLVLRLTEREQTFVLDNIASKPRVASLFRDFSAPVKVAYADGLAPSRDDLAFQMAHDSNPFNRWDASQNLGLDVLLEAYKTGKAAELPPVFVTAFRTALTASDAHVNHMALALPSEKYLTEQLGTDVDPVRVHETREGIKAALARACETELRKIYADCSATAPAEFSLDLEAQQRRALRNTALVYLSTLRNAEVDAMALKQLRDANNMTDAIAALHCLAGAPVDNDARKTALAEFYGKWKDDFLVSNKWLSAQAMAAVDGGLAEVRKLTEHEAFNIENPSKVYAVIGAFASANVPNFHNKDGSGYEFLVDHVLKIDKFNPQVAARILTPLISWKKFDESRRGPMKAQLERLAKEKESLSTDVFEKVEKALSA